MEFLSHVAGLSLDEMQDHPLFIINAFDKEHKVLFWNNRCASHFGIPPEAALGKKLEDVLPWVKTDEKLLYIDRALMGKSMQVLKVGFRMKQGYYEQRIYPVKDKAGKVVAALNIVEDMDLH
jgi:PAS domain-containing protein